MGCFINKLRVDLLVTVKNKRLSSDGNAQTALLLTPLTKAMTKQGEA